MDEPDDGPAILAFPTDPLAKHCDRIVVAKPPPKTCGHHNLETDHHARTITCMDCRTRLDPFEAFMMLARYDWRQDDRLAEIAAYKAEERAKELAAQEKRARAARRTS